MLNLEKDNCCWATTTLLWANDGIVQLFFSFYPHIGSAIAVSVGKGWGRGGGKLRHVI